MTTAELHTTDADMETARELRAFGLPADVFDNQVRFIQVAREGIAGKVLRAVVQSYGFRDLFVRNFDVSSANFSRVYKLKTLQESQSERVLDLLQVLIRARTVLGSGENAKEWMLTPVAALGGEKPVDLCDTFKGRRLVLSVLRKIETGDFS